MAHKDFPIPSSPPGKSDARDAAPGAVRLLVLLNVAVLVCLIGLLARSLMGPSGLAPGAGDDAETLKAVATDLDKREMNSAAAAAWQRCLDAVPDAPDRAELLVRVGQLRVRAGQYDQAADAFVRARLAAPDNKDLQREAEAGLAACQDLSGQHGEIARLVAARRLTPPRKTESPVVAVVGDEKLTEADLDRLIHSRLDQLLAAEGVAGDKARRQAELRQLTNPAVRARFLRVIMQNDLFVRRARELKLDQDPEFVAARDQAAENFLVRRLLEQEVHLPAVTDADLDAFYKAHQAEFHQPESLRVVALRVADDKAAADLLGKIKSADDFRKTADALRQSGGEQAAFGRQVLRGRPDQILGNADKLFDLPEGQWTKQPLVLGKSTYLVLVEGKSPERTPALPEVRQFVQQAVLQERQQEAVDKLFQTLAGRYGVELVLKAPPPRPGGLPGEADQMIGETVVPGPKPGTAPPTPEKPALKPGDPPPTPGEKPENPLRKDAEGRKTEGGGQKAEGGGQKAEGGGQSAEGGGQRAEGG